METNNKFRKSERLCRRKLISELFISGRSFYSYPFRLIWMPVDASIPRPAQMAVSVGKRQFRKAITRNLLKRRIKEAYRKHKQELYLTLLEHDVRIVFMIIYTSSAILGYREIEDKIILILRRLKDEIARSEKAV